MGRDDSLEEGKRIGREKGNPGVLDFFLAGGTSFEGGNTLEKYFSTTRAGDKR